MTFDPVKREINLVKHGIDLSDCEAVFDYPMLTREDTRFDYDEKRLVSLGWLKGKVVFLVWVDDQEYGPRYISCREAEKHERAVYFSTFSEF